MIYKRYMQSTTKVYHNIDLCSVADLGGGGHGPPVLQKIVIKKMAAAHGGL